MVVDKKPTKRGSARLKDLRWRPISERNEFSAMEPTVTACKQARLVTARTCYRNSEIQCSSGFSLAINCEITKEKTRITYSSENSVSESTAIAPSSILDRATELLLANKNGAAVFMSLMAFDTSPFAVAKCAHAWGGGGWGEIAFGKWGIMYFCDISSPSHLLCNLHDL